MVLSKKSQVENALLSLKKRAEKKGIPGVLSWTWGKPYRDFVDVPNVDGERPIDNAELDVDGRFWKVPVTRISLTLVGETPRFKGWTFSAVLQRLDEENIVRTVPGESIPSIYRTRCSHCDHCNTNRKRNDTYVLRHDDGRYVQVGSSCISDFLGGDDAETIVLKAEILSLAESILEDGFGSSESLGPSRVEETSLIEFLPYVAWSIRTDGWTSRTRAKETGTASTANIAWMLTVDAKARKRVNCQLSEEDISISTKAVDWAESISDDEVNSSTSDYLHNVRAVAKSGLASYRTAGIAASIVSTFVNETKRVKRQKLDAHVGSVGERVTFGVEKKKTKRIDKDPLELDSVFTYDTMYGLTTVLKFMTKEGATVVWKTGSTEISRLDVGKKYDVVGTIKSHDVYKNEKQTTLTRCSVTRREEQNEQQVHSTLTNSDRSPAVEAV